MNWMERRMAVRRRRMQVLWRVMVAAAVVGLFANLVFLYMLAEVWLKGD